jgi:hypothetical protein
MSLIAFIFAIYIYTKRSIKIYLYMKTCFVEKLNTKKKILILVFFFSLFVASTQLVKIANLTKKSTIFEK